MRKKQPDWVKNLDSFHGSRNQSKIHHNVYVTEGVKFLCEQAKCYWLMDIIWSYQCIEAVRNEGFQVYTLKVNLKKQKATVICSDGNKNILHRQEIAYTDFPLKSISLWYMKRLVMLPSEY